MKRHLKALKAFFNCHIRSKKGTKLTMPDHSICTMAGRVRCSIKDSRLFHVLKVLKIDGLSHRKSKVSVLSLVVSRQGFTLTHTHVLMDFQYQSSLIVTTAHKPLFFLLWRLGCQICAEHTFSEHSQVEGNQHDLCSMQINEPVTG